MVSSERLHDLHAFGCHGALGNIHPAAPQPRRFNDCCDCKPTYDRAINLTATMIVNDVLMDPI
jgi:hypothetical protein